MLSPLDDFPVHQVPKPITTPSSSDRNAYGRYWFGAMDRTGAHHVELAFGRYPNLRVTDAHLSVSVGDGQHCFHASREAPIDPMELRIGPFLMEILEPMRSLRITVDDNDTGVSGQLTWRARTGALEEDHTVMQDGPRVIVDMLRFVQFGTWEGSVTAGGETVRLSHDDNVGVRDRSWGVRPVGEPAPGRPAERGAGNAWLWAPCHFDDACRVIGWFQRPGGQFWRPDGHVIPVVDPVPASVDISHAGVERLDPVGQRIEFHPGTRIVRRAEFDVRAEDGSVEVLEIEALRRFDMVGIGYNHPAWGHGRWHGELEVAGESWRFADLDPLDPVHQHLHHTVRARIGGREGVGVFEQIIYGPHTQFGFSEFLDGAPA
ncbi:MAG: hypothetical protein KDB21_06135 [Acidimicrobiales bacterium]|nr:hypothetical protein [Acidimicrobiales bacterium]